MFSQSVSTFIILILICLSISSVIFLFYYFSKQKIEFYEQEKEEEEEEEEEKEKSEETANGIKNRVKYEDRMKTKRSEYIDELEDEAMMLEDADNNDINDDDSDDETYIYHLQDIGTRNVNEKILIVAKDDILFDGVVVLENMEKAESILRKVSQLFDNAKNSRNIVIDELEKPITSIQLQIDTLLTIFGDEEREEEEGEEGKEEKEEEEKEDTEDKEKSGEVFVKKLDLKSVESIKEIKIDYSPWIKQALEKLESKEKHDFKASFDAFLKKKEEEEEGNQKETESIEEFRGGKNRNSLLDILGVQSEETITMMSLEDFKVELIDTIEKNSEVMGPLDRFFLIWDKYIEKVEFIKDALNEMIKTLNTIGQEFQETYNAFLNFLPIIERYFHHNLDNIKTEYQDIYPNLNQIRQTYSTNFDYVESLSKEERIQADPEQIENIKKYTHRALRNIIQLMEKDAANVMIKVISVKTAFVDGMDSSPYSSYRSRGRGYRNKYTLFRKSYYNQVMDVKDLMDEIANSTIKYEKDIAKILDMIKDKVNPFLTIRERIDKFIQNAETKNDDSNLQEELETIKSIQDNVLEFKKETQDILDNLSISFDIQESLKMVRKGMHNLAKKYLELPSEFEDFENNIDIYERNALRTYDSSAFIYVSVKSLLYPMLEDIVELKENDENQLFKDFFSQVKGYL